MRAAYVLTSVVQQRRILWGVATTRRTWHCEIGELIGNDGTVPCDRHAKSGR